MYQDAGLLYIYKFSGIGLWKCKEYAKGTFQSSNYDIKQEKFYWFQGRKIGKLQN